MSKLTLFIAVADRGLFWAAIIAVFTGLLTTACFVRAAFRIFWGKAPAPKWVVAPGAGGKDPVEFRAVPATMSVSMAILTLMVIGLGVYPQAAYPLLESATRCILKILGGG